MFSSASPLSTGATSLAAFALRCKASIRSRGYSQDTDAIHVFSVEDSSSRYVLRLVVMTRLVLRPERMGLTSTFTRKSAPLPLDVSPTIQDRKSVVEGKRL